MLLQVRPNVRYEPATRAHTAGCLQNVCGGGGGGGSDGGGGGDAARERKANIVSARTRMVNHVQTQGTSTMLRHARNLLAWLGCFERTTFFAVQKNTAGGFSGVGGAPPRTDLPQSSWKLPAPPEHQKQTWITPLADRRRTCPCPCHSLRSGARGAPIVRRQTVHSCTP